MSNNNNNNNNDSNNHICWQCCTPLQLQGPGLSGAEQSTATVDLLETAGDDDDEAPDPSRMGPAVCASWTHLFLMG